ncbi:MAG: transporter [Xanthobacteraceae bacterium]|nr:transporter [Xanthobacteraceae bacterium]
MAPNAGVFSPPNRGPALGAGDPYFEIAWSRYLGTPRPPRVPGSFPILEGLTVSAGLGVVLPVGQYKVQQVTQQGIGMGNNIFDIAPSAAMTYMTPPIVAEGTEFSAKVYWNTYRTNSATQYQTADLINVDFAISERYGRWQAGITGFYAFQLGGDKQFGVTIPPDGRRTELLLLGGVVAYDMPEFGMAMKAKAVRSVWVENAVRSTSVVVGFFKKVN